VKKVQHMVLLRFKPGVPAERIAGLFAELGRLPGRIAGIEQFAWGPYASPEGLNKGFGHGFLMTFRDAAARDGYLTHPEHERVKEALLANVEDAIAFDFEV
jgi:hypothetical protein